MSGSTLTSRLPLIARSTARREVSTSGSSGMDRVYHKRADGRPRERCFRRGLVALAPIRDGVRAILRSRAREVRAHPCAHFYRLPFGQPLANLGALFDSTVVRAVNQLRQRGRSSQAPGSSPTMRTVLIFLVNLFHHTQAAELKAGTRMVPAGAGCAPRRRLRVVE